MSAGVAARDHRLEPAELLYGRLLASAAGGAAPAEARIRIADGHAHALPLARWLAPVDAADRAVLAQAAAPVLDIGCGPGRHLAALAAAGHDGLGLDLSPVAVRLARARGAEAILRSVFADVPRAGTWRTALLLDGNIGIGGAPAALLARARALVAPGGAVLVETGAAGRSHAPHPRAARDAGGDQPVVRLGQRRRRRDRAAGPGRRTATGRAVRRRRPLVRPPGAAVNPPPGPFRPEFWRSPLRSTRLTSVLGSILLVLVVLVALTGLPLPRRLPARPRSQRPRRPRPAVHDVLRLADGPVMVLRLHPGAARERRPGRHPGRAGEALVGDPAPVPVAARAHAGGGDRARLGRAAGRQHRLPARHRRREHPVLVRLRLRLRQGALLRRGRVRGGPRRPPRGQAPDRLPGRSAPARSSRATIWSRRIPTRPRSAGAGCSPRSAADRSRCSSRTPASRSAGRCARPRSSRRGARAGSRSTRRRRVPR